MVRDNGALTVVMVYSAYDSYADTDDSLLAMNDDGYD